MTIDAVTDLYDVLPEEVEAADRPQQKDVTSQEDPAGQDRGPNFESAPPAEEENGCEIAEESARAGPTKKEGMEVNAKETCHGDEEERRIPVDNAAEVWRREEDVGGDDGGNWNPNWPGGAHTARQQTAWQQTALQQTAWDHTDGQQAAWDHTDGQQAAWDQRVGRIRSHYEETASHAAEGYYYPGGVDNQQRC